MGPEVDTPNTLSIRMHDTLFVLTPELTCTISYCIPTASRALSPPLSGLVHVL